MLKKSSVVFVVVAALTIAHQGTAVASGAQQSAPYETADVGTKYQIKHTRIEKLREVELIQTSDRTFKFKAEGTDKIFRFPLFCGPCVSYSEIQETSKFNSIFPLEVGKTIKFTSNRKGKSRYHTVSVVGIEKTTIDGDNYEVFKIENDHYINYGASAYTFKHTYLWSPKLKTFVYLKFEPTSSNPRAKPFEISILKVLN